MTGSVTPSDLVILRWLAGRSSAAAAAIGAACAMKPGEVRARLAGLESRRLVLGRHDAGAQPPGRVFLLTAEGRRAATLDAARTEVAQP